MLGKVLRHHLLLCFIPPFLTFNEEKLRPRKGKEFGPESFSIKDSGKKNEIAHSEGAIIAEGNRIGLRHYPAQKGLALLLSWTSPRLQQKST